MPTEPDWRRMPASAVPVKAEGPEFVTLRAKDARRYADECASDATHKSLVADNAEARAERAELEARRWEVAAAAFADAWTPTPPHADAETVTSGETARDGGGSGA